MSIYYYLYFIIYLFIFYKVFIGDYNKEDFIDIDISKFIQKLNQPAARVEKVLARSIIYNIFIFIYIYI